MRQKARSSRFLLASALGSLALTVWAGSAHAATARTVAPTARSASASSCGGLSYRWYAWGHSGAGSNHGTGGEIRTWSSWSLAGHSDGFSDEAVWSLDENNSNYALEVGFNTGVGATLSVFSNNMYPYYTLNDGNNEYDWPGTELPKGTDIWMAAEDDGTHAWAYIYNKYYLSDKSYAIPTPRENYEQTEVDYHNIWMGGGSGSNMALEYLNSSNAWYDWGYIDGSADSPYWIQLYQPNGSVQGGYGSAC